MQQEQDSLNVYLSSTGQNINLCTREGADIFIQDQGSSFEGFSSNLETATALQRKNATASSKLNNEDKQMLSGIYFMIDSLAKYSTPAVFATIPKSEIEAWIDHVMTVLTLKTQGGADASRNWSLTGILEQHDAFVLDACIPMFMHLDPVLVALEKGFYKVLADFIQARPAPNLPSPDISESTCLLCSNTVISIYYSQEQERSSKSKQKQKQASKKQSSSTWTVEKTFRKLESCGMLAQFIRCSTVPPSEDREDLGLFKCYDELVHCQVLIKKKFKKGQPCGDLIIDILNGKDGHGHKHPNMTRGKIKQYLTSIARLADLMQPTDQHQQLKSQQGDGDGSGGGDGDGDGDDSSTAGSKAKIIMNKICRHCSNSGLTAEFQKSLQACSRCQQAYYCSKACQIADWKIHKKSCQTVSKTEKKKTDATQHTLMNFAKANYAEIMQEIVEVCDEENLTKGEVLLEVDFMPDESGLAPALQVPAEFTVARSRGYFEGSRPNEPDWFYKHVDSSVYKSNVKSIIAALKDTYQRLTPDHILVLTRYSGGVSVYRLQLSDFEGKGAEMFSDKAVDAVRSAVMEGDYGPLSRIFDRSKMIYFRDKYDIPAPGNADMDIVRRLMNTKFGADFRLSTERRG